MHDRKLQFGVPRGFAAPVSHGPGGPCRPPRPVASLRKDSINHSVIRPKDHLLSSSPGTHGTTSPPAPPALVQVRARHNRAPAPDAAMPFARKALKQPRTAPSRLPYGAPPVVVCRREGRGERRPAATPSVHGGAHLRLPCRPPAKLWPGRRRQAAPPLAGFLLPS